MENVLKSMLIGVVIAWAMAFGSAQAAQGVRIEGDEPGQQIVLHSDGATAEAVLIALGRRYGFDVKIIGTPRSRAVHGTYRGPLEKVMRRILSQQSFVIVRDPDPVVGFDFQPAPKPRSHLIRVVKLIGGGGQRAVTRTTIPPNMGRRPLSLSQRMRRHNASPADRTGVPGRPGPGNRRSSGGES